MASILNQIFDELSSRYANKLITKTLHIRWDTARQLSHIIRGQKELYGIPLHIHGPNDKTLQAPFEFESGHPTI